MSALTAHSYERQAFSGDSMAVKTAIERAEKILSEAARLVRYAQQQHGEDRTQTILALQAATDALDAVDQANTREYRRSMFDITE